MDLRDLADPRRRERLRAHLSGQFAGRPVICGIAPLAGMLDQVSMLGRAGARRPLLLYSSRGAGPAPADGAVHTHHVPLPTYPTMTEELRALDALVRGLPAEARARVDAYDPHREALWYVGPFVDTEPVDGREVAGGRPRTWGALEDKLVADDIWDAVGAPRSPSRVVPVSTPDELDAATRDLDQGHGTVWAADARDGFHGGGEYTRWVVSAEERREARAFFGPRCDRVRVMPFLEGVPCSIHGLVMPDGVAAFRPVELAILRAGRRFVYGGQGTFWDPPAEDRAAMRELVRRTGEHLRERVGYRGGFGIDGVLTADGFRPTELNPRFSGGLATLARVVDVDLFQLLQTNLVAGRDPGTTAAAVEAWALPVMDACRTAQPKAVTPRSIVEESVDLPVSWDGERLRHDATGPLTVTVGPGASGAFARTDAAGALQVGDRVGPVNAAMMRLLDERFEAGFGPVEPPPDVRPARPAPVSG